jgi:hypothetical protein
MHNTSKNQMEIQFGQRYQLSQKDTQRSVKTQCSPNYIKEANQHMIDNKPIQHMNDH